MSRLDRSTLVRAFPDNPRMVADFEALDDFLSDAEARIAEAKATLEELSTATTEFQPENALLTAIAALPNRVGVVEIVEDGSANVRPVDGQDPASLLSRGVAYNVLVGIAGQGTTAQRPATPPDNSIGIYWDTTLAKPIIWAGAALGWRDFTGAVV